MFMKLASLMANQYPAHHCAFTARDTATSLFISTPLVNPDMPMDGYTPEPVGSYVGSWREACGGPDRAGGTGIVC